MSSRDNIKKETSVRQLKHVFAGLAIAAFATASMGDPTYPSKSIRMIVPFTPGGGTDTLARIVGNKLAESMKVSVMIENRPGAGGNIGTDAAAKSPPDGYTIVMSVTSILAINPSLYSKLPYNAARDLTPVSTIATSPLVIVTAENSPYKTIADVIATAKAKPGTVTFGTPGNGTIAHMSGELLQRAAGIKMQHVPYKGAAQALADLMGGQISLYFATAPAVASHIKGGKLRAVAVTSAKRSEDLPSIPTVSESGYQGFDATTWFGFLAPAGTPAPIITRLNTEINRALKTQEVRDKFRAEGSDILGGTPEEFAALLKADLVKWGQVVKESGARLD
jgi:tripartite-type tricarboxylate transporter receptor subunit TctC